MDVPPGPRVQDINYAIELLSNLFERSATLEDISHRMQQENTTLRRDLRDAHEDVNALEHENAQRHQDGIRERAICERLMQYNGKFAGMIYNISQLLRGGPKIKSMIVETESIIGFTTGAPTSSAARRGDAVEVSFEEILHRLHDIYHFVNEDRVEPAIPQQGQHQVAAPVAFPYASHLQGNFPVYNTGYYNNTYPNYSRRCSPRFPLLQPGTMPQRHMQGHRPVATHANPAGHYNGHGYDGRGIWNGMPAAAGVAGYGSVAGFQMQAGHQRNQHQQYPVQVQPQPPPAHNNNYANNYNAMHGPVANVPCLMYLGLYVGSGERALVPPTPPPEMENQRIIEIAMIEQDERAEADEVIENEDMQDDGQGGEDDNEGQGQDDVEEN